MVVQVALLFVLLSILVGCFLYINLMYVDRKIRRNKRSAECKTERLHNEVAQMSQRIGRQFLEVDEESKWARSEVNSIYDKINTLDHRLREISEAIKGGVSLGQERSREGLVSFKDRERKGPGEGLISGSSTDQAVHVLAEAYSASIGGVAKKEAFESEYKPRRVSVANTRERREKVTRVPPIFSLDKSGNYWLVDLEDQKVVLPLPSMTVEDGHRDAGGFDLAFACEHYPKGEIYEIGSLLLPGILERAGSEGQWRLSKPGEVRLKPYL